MVRHKLILLSGIVPFLSPAFTSCEGAGEELPNVLFCIADDQSYPYTTYYGCKEIRTPGFDYVASHGTAFVNAYCTSPGSSPSRASILTGLYPWQIKEAGTHASSFPSEYTCFPDVLESAGYRIGFTGKGWGPGNWEVSGRSHNPAGPAYNTIKCTPPTSGISTIDYSANFASFLDNTPADRPFCFWYGAHEPHRPYEEGSWGNEDYVLEDASVPGFLPDVAEIKGDVLVYEVEISWFDRHLVRCIEELRSRRMLDNTIIIVTADNGMSFPHAKANCYDAGIHVPLAICWGNKVKAEGAQKALVSLIDIFPTLLELTGVEWEGSSSLEGESLVPLLGIGYSSYSSQAVFSGRERHSCARFQNKGYPMRSVRQGNYLLIRNFHPELWPAGDPVSLDENGQAKDRLESFFDIDAAPSKTYLIENSEKESFYFNAAVAKRPEYELFNLANDPDCMFNVADDTRYSDVLARMMGLLNQKLSETGDSRLGENPEIWESYPRLEGPMRSFPNPDKYE